MAGRIALLVAALLGLAVVGPAPTASAAPPAGASPASRAAAPAATRFDWPLRGAPVVDRPFQPPRTAYGRGHRGVDLRASRGEPVLAAGPGRVTYAGLLAGRGVVVVAHDGGLRTTYEPVDAAVRVGQRVRAGSVLGHLATGHASCRAGTTCLHWGLLRGDTYLDPLALVRPWRVRLLPLGHVPLDLARPLGSTGSLGPAGPLGSTGPSAVINRTGGGARVPAGAPSGSVDHGEGEDRGAGTTAAGVLALGGLGLLARRRAMERPQG